MRIILIWGRPPDESVTTIITLHATIVNTYFKKSTINDSAVNENDSHLATLAGARVAGAAGRVNRYIYLLTMPLDFGKLGQ